MTIILDDKIYNFVFKNPVSILLICKVTDSHIKYSNPQQSLLYWNLINTLRQDKDITKKN